MAATDTTVKSGIHETSSLATFSNVVNVPLVLPISILFYSVFQNNLGGIIYLAFVFAAVVIRRMIMQTTDPLKSYCVDTTFAGLSKKGDDGTGKKTPNTGIFVSVYTFIYVLGPMISNGIYNVLCIISLSVIMILSIIFSYGCIMADGGKKRLVTDITLGVVLGMLSMLFAVTIAGSNTSMLLFIRTNKNNQEVCSMPSKQNFVCNAYKNGELLKGSLN